LVATGSEQNFLENGVIGNLPVHYDKKLAAAYALRRLPLGLVMVMPRYREENLGKRTWGQRTWGQIKGILTIS
jgi:hypothetical protein